MPYAVKDASVSFRGEVPYAVSFRGEELGWVLFKENKVPEGRAAAMPKAVLDALIPRKTQIYAAEAFAVLAAVHEHRVELRKSDAIFFIDKGRRRNLTSGQS